MITSSSTAAAPSSRTLFDLVTFDLLRESHPDWTVGTVAQRCQEEGVSAQRVSRLAAVLRARFEEVVRRATQRGRPRSRKSSPPSADPRDALLEVAADVIQGLGGSKKALQDRLVTAARRLQQEHGITLSQFCETLKIPLRTFRYWESRKPAPVPPPPPPPRSKPDGDPHRGRFNLEEIPPGVQIMADTSSWELFSVPLKLIAVQDPGNRDQVLWEACDIDVTEDARRVTEVIAAAAADRPGLQLVTDQGRPYVAAEACQRYDQIQVEHAPAKEGDPVEKATLERSFGLIKPVLAPLVALTAQLAQRVNCLRNATLARTVGKYLVTLALEAYRLGLHAAVGGTRTIDRELWERRAAELRDKALHQDDSRRQELARIHEEYRMAGSRESFVNAYRRHAIEDIKEAERRLRERIVDFETEIRSCDRYFAGILRRVAEDGRHTRARIRQQQEEARERQHAVEEFQREQQALDACPEARVERGFRLIAVQWNDKTGALLFEGRGMGYVDVRKGLSDLRNRHGVTAARDLAEVAYRRWLAESSTTDPMALHAVRRIYDQLTTQELAENKGFPLPPARRILVAQSPPHTPRSPA